MSHKTYNYNKIEKNVEKPEVAEKIDPIVEEEKPVEKTETKKSPEVKTLITNLYIREKPNGDILKKEDFDRLQAKDMISDGDNNAILPRGFKLDSYKEHKEGKETWYLTDYGYVLAVNKHGKSFVK